MRKDGLKKGDIYFQEMMKMKINHFLSGNKKHILIILLVIGMIVMINQGKKESKSDGCDGPLLYQRNFHNYQNIYANFNPFDGYMAWIQVYTSPGSYQIKIHDGGVPDCNVGPTVSTATINPSSTGWTKVYFSSPHYMNLNDVHTIDVSSSDSSSYWVGVQSSCYATTNEYKLWRDGQCDKNTYGLMARWCIADCIQDSHCGGGSWANSPYCNGNDVWDMWNGGKCSGNLDDCTTYCTSVSENRLKQTCSNQICSNGQCISGSIYSGFLSNKTSYLSGEHSFSLFISNANGWIGIKKIIMFDEIEGMHDFADTCIIGDCTAQDKIYTWCFIGQNKLIITSELCDSLYPSDPIFGAYPSLNFIYYNEDESSVYYMDGETEGLQSKLEYIYNPYPNSINLRLIYAYNDLVTYDTNWLNKIENQYNVLKNALSQYNIHLIDIQFIKQYILDTSKLPDEFILKRDIEPYSYTNSLEKEIGSYIPNTKDIEMYFVTNSRYNRPFLLDINNPTHVLAHEMGHILFCIHPGSLGSLSPQIYDTDNIMGYENPLTNPRYKSDCHIILTQFYK